MDRLLELVRGIARVGAWISGFLLFAVAGLIGVDIALRTFLGRSIGGADELAGYALAIASAWGYAFALLGRGHIRIDTLYVAMPRQIQAVLDLLGIAIFTGFMALLSWYAYGVLVQSIDSGSRSISRLETPLMVPQSLWVAGLVFFVLAALLLLARASMALVRNDLATVFDLIGSRASQEEVDERVAGRAPDAEPPR